MKPLMFDFFCGLGGASEGFLAEGWECVGVDNERHDYGDGGYPGHLILQDIMTFHGSQAKDADFLWFSPPCQAFSWMAMPWKLGKQKAAEIREDYWKWYELTKLFVKCFEIQLEASRAAGHHIPLIVENVRGAQPWVGPAKWNYGSFYLWGDVPALMPTTFRRFKSQGMNWADRTKHGQDFTRIAGRQSYGEKVPGFNFHQHEQTGKPGGPFQSAAVKVASEEGRRTDIGKGARFTSRDCGSETVKGSNGGCFNDNKRKGQGAPTGYLSQSGSKSNSRKATSAAIAKIPFPLARWIAKCYYSSYESQGNINRRQV